MPATATLLASGVFNPTDTEGVTNFTTASVTPGADCALVLLVGTMNGNDMGTGGFVLDGATVASSGSGPTWEQKSAGDTAVASYKAVAANYGAVIGGSSPGAFTVTVTAPSSRTYAVGIYALYKITGHDTTTTFAGAASAGNQTGDGARTLTLGAAPATDDVTLALSYCDADGAAGAVFDTGWTENFDAAASGQNYAGGNAGQRGSSTSTSVSWTDVNTSTGSYSSAQTAVIVKASTGGGGGTDVRPRVMVSDSAVIRAANW